MHHSFVRLFLRGHTLPAVLFCSLMASQGSVFAQLDSVRYRLWADDAQFSKLSGAAQNLLIAKFGPKLQRDRKGNLVSPAANTGVGFEESFGTGPAGQIVKGGGFRSAMTALPNNLVNSAAADATAQDTQSETALVLGSASDVISGYNDSGSFLGGARKFTGFSTSANAGSSWTDGGTLPTSDSGDAGDPVLSRNTTTGRIYLSTLAFTGTGMQMFRSDNDGATWLPPVNCAPGMTGEQDKDWNTVDNFAGTGNGNLYVVWRAFSSGATDGIRFIRSTDNGNTFTPSTGILIAGQGAFNVQGAFVTVGTDHSVYVFWLDQSAGGGTPNILRMRKSIDLGVSFGSTTTIATLNGTGVNGDLSLVAGFRSNSFPQVVVNPVSGNLYIVYNDLAGVDHGNIFVRQSTDGGGTWSPAIQVNNDSTTRAQYMPAIAVKPDGSGLSVSWYDNRDDPADRNLARWGATATISGSSITFGPNFRISAVFPPVFGVDPVVNSVYMGDYDQMAADNSSYYTTWGDNRDNSIAVPSRKNANVRFASYTQAGPAAILDFNAAVISGGNGNGQIDSNECNLLNVTIKNNGGTPATAISGTLTTSTSGVLISNGTQSYPDLNPGSRGTNAVPYQVITSPSVACGTVINLTLTTSYAGGSDVINFSISSGGANYVITSSTGSIVPGTTDIGNHCDDCVTPVSLPFPVRLYGSTFSTVNLSSNGNAQFSSSSTEYSNICLPVGTFNNAVFAHWDDLMTSINAGDGIFTSVSGATPDRIFNIEWRATYFPGNGRAHFELRFHENSPQFEMVYDTVTGGGSNATIGVQQGTGPNFSQYACNVSGSVTIGRMLTYTLPPCVDGGGPCGNCVLTCPSNVNVSNDPGRCGAVVNYPPPTTSGSCGTVTSTPASGSFFPIGTTQVNCVSTSGQSCSFTVTVADTTRPTCSITVSPSVLLPINHKLQNVSVKMVSVDNCPGLTCALTSITSSEPDSGIAKGDVPHDIQGASFGTCDTLVQLRAERFSSTADRVYTLTYTVTDGANHSSTCTATVRVPLSRKGATSIGSLASEVNLRPGEAYLAQNYPNPFNPSTDIAFALSVPGSVSLKVFNVLGQEVSRLLDAEPLDEGVQSVEFDPGALPSGVYFYRLEFEPQREEGSPPPAAFVQIRRMLLMR